MKVNKIFKGILEIEDFITQKEQDQILSFSNSIEEKSWFSEIEGLEYNWWNGKVLTNFTNQLSYVFENIHKRCYSLFDNCSEITGINLNRYKNNDALGYHYDQWKTDTDYIIKYGIVIYYNDDYEGGEIHYKDLGIKHKPKAKSALLHRGDILHGTLPVMSSLNRYSSTLFVKEFKGETLRFNKNVIGDINEL